MSMSMSMPNKEIRVTNPNRAREAGPNKGRISIRRINNIRSEEQAAPIEI